MFRLIDSVAHLTSFVVVLMSCSSCLPFKVQHRHSINSYHNYGFRLHRNVVNKHRLYNDDNKFEKLMLGAPYSRPLNSKGSYYAKPFSEDRRVLVQYEVTSVGDLEGTMDHLINQIDNHKGMERMSTLYIIQCL